MYVPLSLGGGGKNEWLGFTLLTSVTCSTGLLLQPNKHPLSWKHGAICWLEYYGDFPPIEKGHLIWFMTAYSEHPWMILPQYRARASHCPIVSYNVNEFNLHSAIWHTHRQKPDQTLWPCVQWYICSFYLSLAVWMTQPVFINQYCNCFM